MIVHVKGIAVMGPGIEHWDALRSHLLTGTPLAPDVQPRPQGSILPGTERRRASTTVKMAVDVAQAALRQSGLKAEDAAVVFASANGDTNTIHQICEALATPERMVSPTRFHNSVHNAAAGYWSIASGSMQPSSSLAAWTGTFAAALVEAAAQCIGDDIPVILAVFDTPFPEPLAACAPGHQPFALALVLDRQPENSLAALRLAVAPDTGLPASAMADPELEPLRCDSSASRSLPLLAAIAAGSTGDDLIFDYVEGLQLRVGLAG
ncbi:3-oxoacyl-ACP synthase [Parasulfuritortus cantonensis]|uniref:3-oxoacyl-ACP synthase n=1 Tax=Parasulfuritortus cantonensis TaxID=2528202 RepID=A0A4R1BF85_9PROT|nr:beta-ketoacyl synthase chain length factor [Parasulfuritortus cantonensis]TCJ15783.1 3-oxoacyl-ACP synthase [Parasulfuritortus cantonensis]